MEDRESIKSKITSSLTNSNSSQTLFVLLQIIIDLELDIREILNSVNITPHTKSNRYIQRKANGLCINCGDFRGKDGTSVRCRPCANKINNCTRKYTKTSILETEYDI